MAIWFALAALCASGFHDLKRVAVVGSGASGLAAIATLKKEYPGRFHVTLFEQDDELGGIMRTVRYGNASDWNLGMVDVGAMAAYRYNYPNLFEFIDAEGIPTSQRKQTAFSDEVFGPDPYLFNADDETKATANAAYLKLLTSLWIYKGSMREYFDEVRPMILEDPNVAEIWPSINRAMIFSTLSLDAPTDHIANALAGHNFTGTPFSETPIGGFARVVAAAAKYADEVKVGTAVTSIRRGSEGGAWVEWVQAGRQDEAQFDSVITTSSPKLIARIVDLTPSELDALSSQTQAQDYAHSFVVVHVDKSVVPEMEPEWAGELPHYVFTPDGFKVFMNGAEPPFIEFFKSAQQFEAKSLPATALVRATWAVDSWKQSAEAPEAIKAFMRSTNGKGGVFYAGVWTADGRFLEGAWTSGMRAAREAAGERLAEASSTQGVPVGCAAYTFQRYALWIYKSPTSEKRMRLPVVPSCYDQSEQVPAYFSSREEYDEFFRDFHTRYDHPSMLNLGKRSSSFLQTKTVVAKKNWWERDDGSLRVEPSELSTLDRVLNSLRSNDIAV